MADATPKRPRATSAATGKPATGASGAGQKKAGPTGEQKGKPHKIAKSSAGLDPSAKKPEPLPEEGYGAAMEKFGLSLDEVMFIEAYITCLNATRSYLSVHPHARYGAAATAACELLKKQKIKAYLDSRTVEIMQDNSKARDQLHARYRNIAYADANELTQYRRDCCRHCYGVDHGYQMTPNEEKRHRKAWEKTCLEAEAEKRPKPEYDPLGGIGYDPRRDPNPECPECFGEGIGRIFIADTRNLSPAAQSLYEGVKVTKDGIEIKMADRKDAAAVLAEVTGLLSKDSTITVNMTSEELDMTFGKMMRDGRERFAKMLEERRALRESDDTGGD